MQRRAIEKGARARGDRVVTWYEEKASAARLRRPVLDQLRRDARRGMVRKLYVFAVDRLSRSGIKDTLTVIEELQHHGCRIVTLNDPFDLDGPGAELGIAFVAYAAKQELIKIGERIAAKRAQVKRWGRPRRVGVVTERKILKMKADDHTVREIAVALKIPKSTVARVIDRSRE